MQSISVPKRVIAAAAGIAIAAALFALSYVGQTAPAMVGAASVDYFLKLDGIDGESTAEGHKNEIEILSWSWGVSNAGTHSGGGGGGAGRASFQDIHFTKELDKSSPKLLLACASGEHIKEATLTARKSGSGKGEQDFYEIKLTDVVCTSKTESGASGQMPAESLSLNYAKIEVKYFEESKDGVSREPVTAGWDLALNKKI